MNGKSVQLAALRRQVAPPAFSDYWAMIGLVGQLASWRPHVALLRCLPLDRAFLMIRVVGQLAARRLQVALPGRLPMDWPLKGH